MWTFLTLVALIGTALFVYGFAVLLFRDSDAGGALSGLGVAVLFGFLSWAMWFGQGPLPDALADDEPPPAEPTFQTTTTTDDDECSLTPQECAEILEYYNEYREDQLMEDMQDDYYNNR